MRSFAQQSKQPQPLSPLNSARPGLVHNPTARQIAPVPRLQRTLDNRAGKLARKPAYESSTGAPATASFAHDFSRIPVHAQEPIAATASDEATDPDAESTFQGDCPPGKAWVAGQHLAPIFIPKVTTARSNSKYSITIPDKLPTLIGSPAVDCKNRVWRYQLGPFVSKVDINIYYFTEDHYPAPQPEDDNGELTNVTKENCKAMVEELYRDKDKVHDRWSAYRRDHLHEDYHYKVEWMGAMNKFVPRFESAVEKLTVPFTMAKTEAEAKKILEPPVKEIHGSGYSKEWHAWDDIPDVTGAGAYLAQVPAIEYLIKRIVNYAKGLRWLPAGYTPGQGALPADPQKGGGQKGEKKAPQQDK